MTALVLAARDGFSSTTAPSQKYAALQYMKRVFRSLQKLPEVHVPNLPATVERFKQDYPALFKSVLGQGGPVECRIDPARLSMLVASIPMRSRSRLMGGCAPAATVADSSMLQSFMQALTAVCQQGPGRDIGLRILSPRGSQTLSLSGPPAATRRNPAVALPPAAAMEEDEGDEEKEGGFQDDDETEDGAAEELPMQLFAAKSAKAPSKCLSGPKEKTTVQRPLSLMARCTPSCVAWLLARPRGSDPQNKALEKLVATGVGGQGDILNGLQRKRSKQAPAKTLEAG